MGDYTDEQSIGRSFTPSELDREVYRREQGERRRCVAPVSFWRVAARMAPAEFNVPPAYASGPWGQRLLPEVAEHLQELVDAVNARCTFGETTGPAVRAALLEALAMDTFQLGFTVES